MLARQRAVQRRTLTAAVQSRFLSHTCSSLSRSAALIEWTAAQVSKKTKVRAGYCGIGDSPVILFLKVRYHSLFEAGRTN